MKIRSYLFLVLFFGALLNCKTRTSNPYDEGSVRKAGPIKLDPDKILNPTTSFGAMMIGDVELQQLIILPPRWPYDYSPTNHHHYDYEVCPKDSSNCESGKFFWGAKLFPNLNKGQYNAKVSPCLSQSPEEICGSKERMTFTQGDNPKNELYDLIQQQYQVSQDIKAQAIPIHEAYKTYKESVFPDGNVPDDEVSQSVNTQLNLGVELIGELINSSSYPTYFNKLYGNNTSTPTPTSNDDQLAAMQSQLDALTKKVESQGASKGISGGGAVLITLGTLAVLSGVAIEGISWAIPYAYQRAEFDKQFNNAFDKGVNAIQKAVVEALSTPEERENLKNLSNEAIAEQFRKKLEVLPGMIGTEIHNKAKTIVDTMLTAKATHVDKKIEIDALIDAAFSKGKELAGTAINFNRVATQQYFEDFHGGPGNIDREFTTLTKGDLTYYFDKKANLDDPEAFKYVSKTASYGAVSEKESVRFVYKKFNNILPFQEIKFKEQDIFSINDNDFNKLPKFVADDFQATQKPNEYKCLRQEQYVSIGKNMYRVDAKPLELPILPPLSEETQKRLILNRSLQEKLPLNKQDYVNGIPLVDKHGRLIKPEKDSLVPGRNWPDSEFKNFKNVDIPLIVDGKTYLKSDLEKKTNNFFIVENYGLDFPGSDTLEANNKLWKAYIYEQVFLKPQIIHNLDTMYRTLDTEIVSGIHNTPQELDLLYKKVEIGLLDTMLSQVKNTYDTLSDDELKNATKDKPLPSLTAEDVSKSNLALEQIRKDREKLKNFEAFDLKSLQGDTGTKIAELDAQIKSRIELFSSSSYSLSHHFEGKIKSDVKNINMKMNKGIQEAAFKGKIAGAVVIIAGLIPILAGSGVFTSTQTNLAEDAKQVLQNSIAPTEINLAKFHLKRLQLTQRINTKLKEKGFDRPDPNWPFHM